MSNTKKAAQRIANAICEIGNASFLIHGCVPQNTTRLSEAREKLFYVLHSLGYEFANSDSRRVSKVPFKSQIETAASIIGAPVLTPKRKAMSKRL